MVKREPDVRHIIWLFDPFGRAGKSTLVKYLCFIGIAHIISWDEQRDVFLARKYNAHKKVFLTLQEAYL